MCGIAGILSKQGNIIPDTRIRGMMSKMVHRGPDAEGAWSIPGLAMGHRRLKILDLSESANQPFTDGYDALVFNGEIFNYAELRDELTLRYSFKTRSDTEVLFRCLQEWGDKALNKIQGQFAFAFYRADENTLLLARDHAGICPLYIRENGDALYFASEIKPLLTLSPSTLDPQGVVDYFTYRYNIQNGHTLFEGIRRFPPAHFLMINLNNGSMTEQRYWRLKIEERKRSAREIQEEFNGIFDEEVSDQNMGDVPVGIYLSGGIDSGALLCGFAKTSPEIRSYTLTFSSEDSDYSRVQELARQYRFGTNLIEFNAANFNVLEDVVESLEEPFGDLIISANYLLAQHAASQVKVVLSGEGGDEAFCGYDHQRSFVKLMGLSANPLSRIMTRSALAIAPARVIGLASSYPGAFGSYEKSRISDVFRNSHDPAGAYLSLVSLFSPLELGSLLSGDFKKKFPCPPDTAPIRKIFAGESVVWKAVMRAEIEQLTLIVNLLKQDRFGMRFSLEGRVPFVSRRVLEFAGSLPYHELFSRTNKQYVLGYSGSRTIKKKPFSLFSGEFYIKALVELMDRYLTEENIGESGVLSFDGVKQLRIRAEQGGMLSVKQTMSVLVFIIWYKVFRDGGYILG
jgi:asparagine synthase (glutamine-hydrolysing)